MTSPVQADRLCILITVYHPYRWIAPYTWEMIQRFWPGHPPVFFCGLTSEEAGDLPHLPVRDSALPRVWADFADDAAKELQQRGFEAVYFFLEDHMPLAPCHTDNLHHLLPGLLNSLPASYIGLMGWDNRRFATRSGPVLGRDKHRFLHLLNERAPRFHLHPSLFRMETLVACLSLLRQSSKPNPWGFEKLCDKPGAALPLDYKASCYQICGADLALDQPGHLSRALSSIQNWFFHRMMSFAPTAFRLGFGPGYLRNVGFDNFFYNGPFPMFYSGVMAGGRVNPFFINYLERRRDPAFEGLIAASRAKARE